MSTKIVVVGPNCWGAGKDLRQAVAKARINYPASIFRNRPMDYNAYEASDDFNVDCFGAISATELKKIREVRHTHEGRIVRTSGFTNSAE